MCAQSPVEAIAPIFCQKCRWTMLSARMPRTQAWAAATLTSSPARRPGAPASIVACVLRGGLYGGLAAHAARVVPHTCLTFSIVEALRSRLT